MSEATRKVYRGIIIGGDSVIHTNMIIIKTPTVFLGLLHETI